MSSGSEMLPVFPPPPRLPPRRPVDASNNNRSRPNRADSLDLLDTVPPAPTAQMLMMANQVVSQDEGDNITPDSQSFSWNQMEELMISSSTTGSTNDRQQVPCISSSSSTKTPAILVSNSTYFASNESNRSQYERLSSSHSIPHSASAPNGFNNLSLRQKNQTLPSNFTPSFTETSESNHGLRNGYHFTSHLLPDHLTPFSRSLSSSCSLSSLSSSSRGINHGLEINIRNIPSTSSASKDDQNLIDLTTLEDHDVLSLFDPLTARQKQPRESASSQELESGSISRPKKACESNGKNDRKATLDTNKVIEFEKKMLGRKASSASSTTSSFAGSSVASSPGRKTASERNNSKRLIVEKKSVKTCCSLDNFLTRVRIMRGRYLYDDGITNTGLVVSPIIETQRDECDSVKLVITSQIRGLKSSSEEHPVVFTCNVSTSIEHIISHTVCSIMEDVSDVDFDSFLLKIFGRNEFLARESILQDYTYVLECHKFDRDVRLTLVRAVDVDRIFVRTHEDDLKFFEEVTTELLIPHNVLQEFALINFTRIKILIETLDREVEKVVNNCRFEPNIPYTGVKQAVQAIASQLANMESEDLKLALEDFTERVKTLADMKSAGDVRIGVEVDSNQMSLIETSINKIYMAVREIIQLYSITFPVDFAVLPSPSSPSSSVVKARIKKSVHCTEDVICYIGQLSQPNIEWNDKFRKFFCLIELFHGDRKLAGTRTETQYLSTGFLKFPRIQFEEWVTFEGIPLKKLPRETCLYFSIIGIEYVDPDAPSPGSSLVKREVNSLLSLSILRLFDSHEILEQGPKLLSMWENKKSFSENDKFSINSANFSKDAPVLTIRLPEFDYNIKFPEVSETRTDNSSYQDMRTLNSEIQTNIYQVLNRDPVEGMLNRDKELLWINRGNLISIPSALPKVFQSTKDWDYESLQEIYSLIDRWSELSLIDAMQLLTPSFPDTYVRSKGVQWITREGYDGLICDFLPQLIQAVRFEPYFDSPLILYLLETSLKSVRVAHQLYWLLKENVNDALLGFRSSVLLNTLLAVTGSALNSMIQKEEKFQMKLSIVNENVKSAKENSRLLILQRNLDPIDDFIKESGLISLPLSPSTLVTGLVIQNCSYFTSKTLPLKLTFLPTEANCPDSVVEAIFKVGDDLRQDTLTMQMIRIMDKLWLKEGLDLKIVTFNCVSTEERKGFVEMISKAETLRQIQMESGIQGTFNERSIIEWLRKHNTHELDYFKATGNFVRSCAGYAVATYILGVCDRHNDNIMITTSGHLFHIDFGKFLGDAQMMGNIKRDRVPFILSKEMVYVINGGSDSSKHFQFFVELCCSAFNIVRKHSNLFLSLFSLMTSASIPGVTSESVKYVHQALLPELSEAEAMAAFTTKIDESSRAMSVQLNFIVHSLAQLRFTGDHNDQRLLSFVPKTCTRETEARIRSLHVVGYFKKYDPDKQYFHVVQVEREHQRDAQKVSRSYQEFYEFYQKLCSLFPLAPLSLSRATSLGRGNTQQVAEKRKRHLNQFLIQLMCNAEEIAHSDLVYTFFQPLLRDQELAEGTDIIFGSPSGSQQNDLSDGRFMREQIVRQKGKRIQQSNSCISTGQVHLSLVYKNKSLIIMIRHAKGLVSRVTDKQPNTYVKTKLTPDPRNETKRKTKIVSKNANPSFMELIVYNDIPLNVIQERVLNVSVWESSTVKGSIYLGAALIPLGEMNLLQEIVSWYPFT